MESQLIIFDLDGVLLDSKEAHYSSLNLALEKIDKNFIISEEDQRLIFEGLPTKEKLDILTKTRGLEQGLHYKIWKLKQEISSKIFKNLSADLELYQMLSLIKKNKIKIAIASNSIRKTVDSVVESLGIKDLVDFSISSDEVFNPKPSPEIYNSCMDFLKTHKTNTVIFEDSIIGLIGANRATDHVIEIKDRKDLTIDKIQAAIDILQNKVNIVIPMAGLGSRFAQSGYKKPKPLIDLFDKTMIENVIDNLNIRGRYFFIVQEDHVAKYQIDKILKNAMPGCNVIPINGISDGAASTCLFAKKFINNLDPLIIANSDQIVDWDSNSFIETLEKDIDGIIATFKSNDPKWSFIKIENEKIVKVAEKNVISSDANVGIYGWKKGSDYVKYAEQMISKKIKTNGEYYVSPVYNEAIDEGKKIIPFFVNKMHGIGTPEDLEEFIDLASQ